MLFIRYLKVDFAQTPFGCTKLLSVPTPGFPANFQFAKKIFYLQLIKANLV